MTVTEITAVTKTKYKVFIDGQFAFVLYKGELSRYGIREGHELTAGSIQSIMEETVCKRAKLYAMHLLERMDRSEAGLREKMGRGMYPQEAVEQAIRYVKSFGYVDDERYARNFVQSRKATKSQKEIYYLLCQKGIDRETAKEAVEECFGGAEELEAIRRIAVKKRIDPDTASPQEIRKLYGYLARKGFRYEDIRQVIQNRDENA